MYTLGQRHTSTSRQYRLLISPPPFPPSPFPRLSSPPTHTRTPLVQVSRLVQQTLHLHHIHHTREVNSSAAAACFPYCAYPPTLPGHIVSLPHTLSKLSIARGGSPITYTIIVYLCRVYEVVSVAVSVSV